MSDLLKELLSNENVALAKRFSDCDRNYVYKARRYIHNKWRFFVTYNEDEKGAKLRDLHDRIAEVIPHFYESSEASCAYKKGKNILDCVKKHEHSRIFLKTDIHHYFGSITFESLYERLLVKIKEKVSDVDEEKLRPILETCFYDGTLPLGYTSSPVLSDFYLSGLDHEFEQKEGVIYSRYADDFLISCKSESDEEKLQETADELKTALIQYGLILNKKKTYTRKFLKKGDAIHVLGVNLVCDEAEKNRITIGNGYLRETCKELAALDPGNAEEKRKVFGKIAFIRMCSKDSFSKFRKLVKIKLGEEDAKKIVL